MAFHIRYSNPMKQLVHKKIINKVISMLLICTILISFASCQNTTEEIETATPLKAGEISTNFPDSFRLEKNEFNPDDLRTEITYSLGAEWYGKKINFRNHITVSEDTTWVLSKNSKGTDIVDNFTVELESLYNNVYFVLCYDNMGYLSTYKIQLYVEYEIKRYFFTYIDYDYITDFIKTHNIEIGRQYGLSIPEIKFIGYNLPDGNILSKNNVFFQVIEGENFPTENPSREGYIFDGWEEFNHPIYGKVFSNYKFLFLENNYLPKVYVAKWIPAE